MRSGAPREDRQDHGGDPTQERRNRAEIRSRRGVIRRSCGRFISLTATLRELFKAVEDSVWRRSRLSSCSRISFLLSGHRPTTTCTGRMRVTAPYSSTSRADLRPRRADRRARRRKARRGRVRRPLRGTRRAGRTAQEVPQRGSEPAHCRRSAAAQHGGHRRIGCLPRERPGWRMTEAMPSAVEHGQDSLSADGIRKTAMSHSKHSWRGPDAVGTESARTPVSHRLRS